MSKSIVLILFTLLVVVYSSPKKSGSGSGSGSKGKEVLSTMASDQPWLTLSNGFKIPQLGFGTWKSTGDQATQVVKDAIDAGYRHIDCADAYENEVYVGKGINAKIAEGVVKREDLFITSKLWNTYHHRDWVLHALNKQLKNLNIAYLDLYLIHWPMAYKPGDDLFPRDDNGKIIFSNDDFIETWKEMERAVDLGLTKSIGISNFNEAQTERIYRAARIKPVVNQVECHPYLNQQELIKFLNKYDILVTAHSPLGSPDRPWADPKDPAPLNDKTIHDLATKYGKTPAQIMIRYQIQRGNAVIPKSVKKERIVENFQVFDFELSKEDMKKLDSLNLRDGKGRIGVVPADKTHSDFPY